MTTREAALWGSVPVTYLLLLALGRWLKRRWGVPLGLLYHLFCIAAAAFLPMSFVAVPEPWLRFTGSAVALLGTLFLLALLRRGVWEIYFGERRGQPVPKFATEVVSLVILVVAVLIVLSTFFDVRIPGLLAGSGIVAIILGLALQDTLGNVLAGLALHFEKPYKAGDWLIVDNRHAEVVELNWRATRLRTNDDIYLDIPNSQLAKATIVNLSFPTSVHAMRMRVSVDYSVPPNEVKDVLLHAARQAKGVLKTPPPKVFLIEFGESAVIYEIKYSMDDHARFNEVADALRTNIWYELKRHGMRIPFPIRTVHMASGQTDGAVESRAQLWKVLRNQPLFACFADEQLEELASKARRSRFGRGETIIEQGDKGASMFVLVHGSANVTVASPEYSARVAELRAGDCFGEMSLLTGEPRSASVIAQTDCDVMEIDRESVASMLQRAPQLTERLSELLARRRMETEGILANAALARTAEDKQKEYATTFLRRLQSFFEL